MKIRIDNRRGFAAMLWVMIVFFLIFVVIIGGIFITIVRTIHRIVPPPPPDEDGNSTVPGIGDSYMGGVVEKYVPPPHYTPEYIESLTPPGFTTHRVYIFAAGVPKPLAWTNCIWQGDLTNVESAFGTNGLPTESWPDGQQPSQRFYNIVVSNSFSQ